jgi:hypothetical protein
MEHKGSLPSSEEPQGKIISWPLYFSIYEFSKTESLSTVASNDLLYNTGSYDGHRKIKALGEKNLTTDTQSTTNPTQIGQKLACNSLSHGTALWPLWVLCTTGQRVSKQNCFTVDKTVIKKKNHTYNFGGEDNVSCCITAPIVAHVLGNNNINNFLSISTKWKHCKLDTHANFLHGAESLRS